MRILAFPLALILSVFLLAIVLFPQAPPVQAADDHGDDRDTATTINTLGTKAQGRITQTALNNGFDLDYFSFKTLRGVRYTITAQFQTVERVNLSIINAKRLATERVEVQSDLVRNESDKSVIEWTAKTQDTYFVEVKAHHNKEGKPLLGTYSLSITADNSLADYYGDTYNYAYQVEIGKQYQSAISPWENRHTPTGTIHYSGNDRDFFAFQAKQGAKYTVSVGLGTSEGVAISVINQSKQTVLSNKTAETTLEWVAQTDGIHYVHITGTGRVENTVGTYAITINEDESLIDRYPENRTKAESIIFGRTYQGAISPSDDLDYFSFQSKRGAKYTIEVMLGDSKAVDVAIEKTSGGIETSHVADGTDLYWVAPSDNTYYLVISKSSRVRGEVGAYTLRVTADNSLGDQDDNNTGTATPLLLGGAMASAISPPDDQDYFSFEAIRGVKYTAEVQLSDDRTMDITVTDTRRTESWSLTEGCDSSAGVGLPRGRELLHRLIRLLYRASAAAGPIYHQAAIGPLFARPAQRRPGTARPP